MATTVGDRIFDKFISLTNAKDPYRVATDLRNLSSRNLGTAARAALGTAGTVVRAPEWGVSERAYAQTKPASYSTSGGGGSSWGDGSAPTSGSGSGSGGSTGSGDGGGGDKGGNSYDGPSEEERQRMEAEKRLRGQIDDRYTSYLGGINQAQSLIPQRQQEDMGFLQNKYGQFQQGLEGARQGAYDKLGMARSGVAERRAGSITELGQNLGSLMRSTALELGAAGAGDSSASEVMAPYAFAKLGNQGFADINRQANTQYNEIDMQEVDVANTYQSEIGSLQQWLGDQEQQVTTYYRGLLDQLEAEKRGANDVKMEALQQLELGIFNQAEAQVAAIQQQARDYALQLDSWAKERLATLNDAKIQIQNSANFNPRDIVQSELQGLNMGGGNAYGGMQSAIGGLRRREEDY
jgi:hypothetical protein